MLNPEEQHFLENEVGGYLKTLYVETDESYEEERKKCLPALQAIVRLRHKNNTVFAVRDAGRVLSPYNWGLKSKLCSDLVDTAVLVAQICDACPSETKYNPLAAMFPKMASMSNVIFRKVFEYCEIKFVLGCERFFGVRDLDLQFDLYKDLSLAAVTKPATKILELLKWLHKHRPLTKHEAQGFCALLEQHKRAEVLAGYFALFGPGLVTPGCVLKAVQEDSRGVAAVYLTQLELDSGHIHGVHEPMKVVQDALLFVKSKEMLYLLLDHGAIPAKTAACLHNAVQEQRMDVVRVLIEAGISPGDRYHDASVMCIAAANDFHHLIPVLCDLKVPIRCVEAKEINPLAWAKSPTTFKALMDHGASVTTHTLMDALTRRMSLETLDVLFETSKDFFLDHSRVGEHREIDAALLWSIRYTHGSKIPVYLESKGGNKALPDVMELAFRYNIWDDKSPIIQWCLEAHSKKDVVTALASIGHLVSKAESLVIEEEKDYEDLQDVLVATVGNDSIRRSSLLHRFSNTTLTTAIAAQQTVGGPIVLPLARLALLYAAYFGHTRAWLHLVRDRQAQVTNIPVEWYDTPWFHRLSRKIKLFIKSGGKIPLDAHVSRRERKRTRQSSSSPVYTPMSPVHCYSSPVYTPTSPAYTPAPMPPEEPFVEEPTAIPTLPSPSETPVVPVVDT